VAEEPRALLGQDGSELHERGEVRRENESAFVFSGARSHGKEMSTRALDRALDALEGRTPPNRPKPASVDVVLAGDSKQRVLDAIPRSYGAEERDLLRQLSGCDPDDAVAPAPLLPRPGRRARSSRSNGLARSFCVRLGTVCV
jgi:hypothetical protein